MLLKHFKEVIKLIPIEYKKIKTPIKIGETENVDAYAASLKNGEEQLLVSRTGKLFLTNGAGSYLAFKCNDAYNIKETDDKFASSEKAINEKIQNLSDNEVSLRNEFSNYALKNDHDTFKLQTENNISDLHSGILDIIDELIDTTTIATHANRNVLNKFNEDTDGNPLYDGKKIVADFDTSKIDSEIASLNARSVIGKKLDYIFCKLESSAAYDPNQNIPFIEEGNSQGLEIVNGIIILKAGKTYLINIALDETLGVLKFIYDITNDKILGAQGDSYYNTTATTIIECKTDIQIAARVDKTTNFASTIGSYFQVIEIGRTTIIDPAEDVKRIQFEHGLFTNASNQPIVAETILTMNTQMGGNIRLSDNGYIPLKAGKTYKIHSIFSTNKTYADNVIYDVTNSIEIGVESNNVATSVNQLIAVAEYTPKTDCELTVKCGAIDGALAVEEWTIFMEIEEIAQPYYFNYYKDSISSTVLFDGAASSIGDYELLDNINNYEYLIIISSFDDKLFYNTVVSKYSYEKNMDIDNTVNSVSRRITFMVKDSALTIDTMTNNEKLIDKIEKVIGIGFNYENPYRDIVTTIEDFTVTDVEADKAIIDIWNEVGI